MIARWLHARAGGRRQESTSEQRALVDNNREGSRATVPRRGRLLGIDFGTVRIGLAISDGEQSLASPWQTYNRRSESQDREFFVKLVQREHIAGIVVGLPVHLGGGDNPSAQRAEQFGGWLREITHLPVVFYDERFTTSWAEELLRAAGATSKRRKQLRDKLAAQILLTAYLESTRGSEPETRSIDD